MSKKSRLMTEDEKVEYQQLTDKANKEASTGLILEAIYTMQQIIARWELRKLGCKVAPLDNKHE